MSQTTMLSRIVFVLRSVSTDEQGWQGQAASRPSN
jgi:hypothetical protein